ncbi:hypothetical protein SBA3_2900003 [Candidatus Sulfopaludibacter sp. SbA3]|nr:hypothetical protein SBA3_2900003 [Candidatus Sulfopaludibacter sp. SbA3]
MRCAPSWTPVTQLTWDHHNNLRQRIQQNAREIDRPIAALIADLKQRDMLKDTLLVWGGEFGRTTSARATTAATTTAAATPCGWPAAA